MSRRAAPADVKMLQRELDVLLKQVAYEAQRREEMTKLLVQEKAFQPVPEEHIAAMGRRDEESRRLREELAEMKYYLAKGVSEAKRLANVAETLRSSKDQVEESRHTLQDDHQRLVDTKRALEIEIETSKGATARQVESKMDVESKVQRMVSGAQEIINEADSRRQEAAYLRAQVEELNILLRKMERVDHGADNLSAATRRALHQLTKLQKNVATGASPANPSYILSEFSNAENTENSDYDSADDAEPSANAQVVCNAGRATISKCESVLATLHSTLSRFEGEERNRLLASRRQRAELVEQMKSEQMDLKARSDHHLQTMKGELVHREPLLARYSEVRAAAMNRNQDKVLSETFDGTVPLERPFNLIEFLQQENKALQDERQQLCEQQQKLASKCDKRQNDYNAVRELRHTYRDLEAKRTMLSIDLRTEEEENKKLKMTMWSSGATPLSPEVALSASGKRQPWKSTPQQY